MTTTAFARARRAALALAAFTLATAAPAVAAPQDYQFEIVAAQVKQSKEAIIGVRLVHKPTGKPVPDAVIFRTRLDMSPDDMGAMVSKITPIGSDEPGVYRFKADMDMAGRYALDLAAKVQGEVETVRAKFVIEATE
jgi:hypothetical protein